MRKIAIVAALEREVAPLIGKWTVRTIEHAGQSYRLFEKGNAAAVCGGIGSAAARRATEAIIAAVQPGIVLSVGFAGALDPSLKVAAVLEPRIVVNAGDGSRSDTGRGAGTLVTAGGVASAEQKFRLREAYAAVAVDMEAAAVAQGAQSRGVSFAAIKAVSDEAGFDMPPMDHFVDGAGKFRLVRFVLHVAIRPSLWVTTMTLARNSARAGRALHTALEQYLSREAAG